MIVKNAHCCITELWNLLSVQPELCTQVFSSLPAIFPSVASHICWNSSSGDSWVSMPLGKTQEVSSVVGCISYLDLYVSQSLGFAVFCLFGAGPLSCPHRATYAFSEPAVSLILYMLAAYKKSQPSAFPIIWRGSGILGIGLTLFLGLCI